MQQGLSELQQQIAQLTALVRTQGEQIASLRAENAALRAENQRLKQQNAFLCRQLFGRKSEKLDPGQLELAMRMEEAPFVVEPILEPDPDEPPPGGPRGRRKNGERKVGIPEGTPTEEVVIDPEEVRQDPEAYVCIGEEVTRELDVVPNPYILRLIKRRKFKSKADRSRPPLVAPAPARLIPNSCASAGLLTDIFVRRYVDHLPYYRQSQIMKLRYGIDLPRQTLCDWAGVGAGYLKPVYEHVARSLRKSGYLQVDETPVRYLGAEGGGSGQGYLWVFHHPGQGGRAGDVLYEWHTGRGADCLEGMLDDFRGRVQCDGYSAYTAYAKGRDDIDLAGCWAHARRGIFEALEEAPGLARWLLHQIGLLYRIEAELRERRAGPRLRGAIRSSQSAMILARIEKVLRLKLDQHLPKGLMGGAIAYALGQWERLMKFRDDGRLEIDNNLVENAIRPTAIGKKNWLFFGTPDAGERSAILYTLLESCKRRGIDQVEYLRDVLTRLPTMKITEVDQLTPANWAAARKAKAA
jgi:transposase